MTFKSLFTPTKINGLDIANRFAMAPMTRQFSPGQTPHEGVVEYYKKRAEGNVGLIITEGTTLSSMESTMGETVPMIDTNLTAAQWKKVTDAVHTTASKIAVQIWHVGSMRRPDQTKNPDVGIQSPSGLRTPEHKLGEPLTEEQIQDVITDYGQAAQASVIAGFDAIELHGAHGYLIDQFLWEGTNVRTDKWGGSMLNRAAFAIEVIKATRAAVGKDYPIILRTSQWKQQNFEAKLAPSPDELGNLLTAFKDAGVDSLHCSTRRYWEPEFEGSPLNFAGWAKKLTGLHSITVGSVGLNAEFISTYATDDEAQTNDQHLIDLDDRISNGEFDMVAIGRALIANANWVALAKQNKLKQAKPFARPMLGSLD